MPQEEMFSVIKGESSKIEVFWQMLSGYGNPKLNILNKCSETKPTIIYFGN